MISATDKIILDPCCGSRMMWYDKSNPLVVFSDIRQEEHTLCDGRHLSISPDYVLDAKELPFPDESFYHIVQDWPHLKKLGKNSWMAKKYGVLLPTWQTDVKGMFDEGMRVLRSYGTMVVKWNESQITETELLSVLNARPLYGHRSGKGGKTIWMCFMKIPA